MVKNLPAVERSTEIRFGKHVPDSTDQADNTIVFNASNVLVPTPYSNSVYLSPIRNRPDYTEPQVVLLMYDKNTKEITESGESANALVGGATLALTVDRANVTSNTVQFRFADNNTGFVTDSNVGISNLLPQHTVSVGSNLYIDEFGSNVLVVSGNVAVLRDMVIDGNLRVNGDTTVIYTENTAIKDAFIELGQNNTSADTTLDLGILMHRPGALSNVVIGYREGTDEFAIGYTEANPTDKTFTPKTDEDINVHVYGLTHVDANIYAHEDILIDGNVYVSQNVSVTEELTVSNNVYAQKDLEVVGNVYVDGNVVAYKDFTLTGNAYVSGNVSVTEELTISNNVYADKDLEVMGNVYMDGNVVAYKDLLVSGNVYVSQNVNVTEELTISNNVYADKDLEVMGNVYVDGNVNVTKQLSVSGNAYVSGNVEVTKSLIVSANTHLKGPNVFVTNTMNFLDPTTAIVTDQVSNVQIRLGQLENVSNTASNPLAEEVLRYDGNQWMNAFPNHSFLTIKNAEPTATLVSGNAVYISGYQNQNLARVKLARADSPLTMPAIGIVYGDDIPPDEEGLAAAYGKVNQMNTNGYQVGETLYVSNLYAGWISNLKPYYTDGTPNLIQNVGVVTRKDTNSGAMFVTGIGRANDIPNAQLITDYNDMNYVYVNDVNNDFKKIASPNLNIPLTTAVSSSSNSAANAVTLRGVSVTSGDGFHGDLVVAGNVTVDTTTFHVDAETNRVGLGTTTPKAGLHVAGNVYVTSNIVTGSNVIIMDTTTATSKNTGALRVLGGLGVEANIHSTNVFAVSHIAVGTSETSNTFDVRGTSNVGALVATSTHISDATAVNSKTTGALQVTGGVGIQGDIHATHANFEDVEADSVTVTDATAAIDKTSGALQVTGGVGIQGDLYAADTTLDSVKPLNMSTNTLPITDGSKKLVNSFITQDNGAIIISGNVEITGNISVLGNSFQITSNDLVITDRIITIANNNPSHDLDIGIIMEHPSYNIGIIHHGSTHTGGAPGHHMSFGYINEAYNAESITWKDTAHITANVWGHLITQNTITIEHNDLFVVDGRIGVGVGDRENDNRPSANLHVVGNAYVTSNITTSSNVLVMGDAAATSKTTGALQVVGGVGVQGDVHATNVTGSGTASFSTLYGTIEGSNTASFSTLYGTIEGSNTGSFSTLYGTIEGSNTASFSTLYGTIEGSNTASFSTLYGTIEGSNTASFSTLYGTIEGSNTASVSTLTVGGTTQATDTLTGAITVVGGISTQTNVHAANVYISGGLVTNTGGVTRKTYSYSGTIGDTEQPHINVCFTNHSFTSKITAQLIEGDDEISSIIVDCCGGNKGGNFPASDIKTGSVQVFGPASTNAWNVAVVTDKTTVALRPYGALDGAGEYHIFVEYTTAKTAGAVANVVQDTTEKVVFGY
ncbi:hypothetical protein OTV1_072 [Ostreococcus tauri virus 1]|uniref:hypothetical protein n=1 Tax=Ostreococcus tauri virus 1 TaxID=642926 RepID=UPI0001B5F654|nr:hypothetical protein OTV1_072 [Ostreococcus tauri virus 1]CAY39660.1 hypothetical protein OTV1_072 [Ostreococcus tauri virus 1]